MITNIIKKDNIIKNNLFLFFILVLLFSIVTNNVNAAPEKNSKKKSDAHIIGHVLRASDKTHMSYVTIKLKGTQIGAITDATGHFLIKNVPEGDYTIVASFLGYTTEEKNITIVRNKTTEVEFFLKEQAISFDEVVVTSSRNETSRREAATIVDVVTPKVFDNTISNNVAEVLNFQSGLRVENTCQNCACPSLRINGLDGQYSQILIDTRPILSSLASVYGLEQLPVEMIERIEVVRGGGSALFGSTAIGGVVNIITKEPSRNTFSLTQNYGLYDNGTSFSNSLFNTSLVTDEGDMGVYLYGSIQKKDAYDRDDDDYSEIPQTNNESVGFRSFYKFSNYAKLKAEYHHIHEFRRGGNKRDRMPHEADICEQLEHDIDGGEAALDLYSKDYSHHVNLYSSLQKINRNSYFGTNQNLDAYGQTRDLSFVAGGYYSYVFDKCLFMPSELIIGAEFNDNQLNDTILGYNRYIEQQTSSYGLYLQNEWENEDLTFLVGGRLDKHNKIENVIFSPRVNVRYSPIKPLSLRASFSTGYRAPQCYSEDLHVAAVGGNVALIIISPDLKPEYSNSFSGSVDYMQSFGNNQLNLIADLFYTNLNDVFSLVEKGRDEQGNLLLERINENGAVVKGVNLEAKYSISTKLLFDIGTTIQRSEYKEEVVWSTNENLKPQTRMFRTPDYYGYLVATYTPINQLNISLSANYTGEMLVQHLAGYIDEDEEVITPDFFDIGLKASYDFYITDEVTLQVNCAVKNILNSFQSNFDHGPDRDASFVYGPTLPRTIYFGLKCFM